MANEILQPVRECGYRKEGCFYLSSECSSDRDDGVLPRLVKFDPPIPCKRKVHRGVVLVDGNAIVSRYPEDEWLAGTSKRRLEKERGDQWAISVFGMTTTMRLRTGDCQDCATAEEALNKLAERIKFGMGALQIIRSLSEQGVQDMPNMQAPFTKLLRSTQEFAYGRSKGHLLQSVAAVWEMAGGCIPIKRAEIIPSLSRLLYFYGLIIDAADLYLRYNKSL